MKAYNMITPLDASFKERYMYNWRQRDREKKERKDQSLISTYNAVTMKWDYLPPCSIFQSPQLVLTGKNMPSLSDYIAASLPVKIDDGKALWFN